MSRTWYFLGIAFALLLGLGAGLGYAWVVSPRPLNNASPALLRADFKDQYRSAIAAAYAATGNLPRAQARLSLLGDENPVEALNAQAQRSIARGDFADADRLAALAFAMQAGAPVTPAGVAIETSEPPPPVAPSPTELSFVLTETPEALETAPPATPLLIPTVPPRPTRTPPPTPGAPFRLVGQDTVCDPNLPEGLLQIIVFNASRRQMPGVKIIVTWDTGGEEIFTGFKPELGNGYADFLMTAGVSHAVQLALGSEIATGLIPPTCRTASGETYLGGYKLTFQQP
ncbi:MAG: hypothetical protein ACOYYF_01395 [Chloroflexota bacterium]|nr:hypothetical protein [Chloroflexota bacterium]MBI5703846.1 hypothetical protein [Chloroflexota bacterium]